VYPQMEQKVKFVMKFLLGSGELEWLIFAIFTCVLRTTKKIIKQKVDSPEKMLVTPMAA